MITRDTLWNGYAVRASTRRNQQFWLGFAPSVQIRFSRPNFAIFELWRTHFEWWYRNLIGDDQFSIQGYRRHRIRPDFVVQDRAEQKSCHRVIVIESKGKHLDSNPDTTYKRNVAEMFEKVGHEVTWQQLGEDFKDHVFRFQILDEAQPHGGDWSDALTEILSADD